MFRADRSHRKRICRLGTRVGLRSLSAAAAALLLVAGLAPQEACAYEKATEGELVVRGKLMPKKNTFEANVDGGLILNQSYVNTFLIHGTLGFHWSENWGLALEGAMGLNQDKSERTCIENFYNNPQQLPQATGSNCYRPDLESEPSPPQGGNIGPAYVPIREIQYLAMGNLVWSPVYGKQLLLMSAVVHFDLFINFGGGIAMSRFYDQSLYTREDGGGLGRPTRVPPSGAVGTTAQELGIGCQVTDENCYGILGRPDYVDQMHPLINIGIGQKLHFSKNFSMKLELRNMTLLGTQSYFENLFALWAGLGLRL